MRGRFFYVAVVVIGCASMLTQLTLLREFLNIYYGNELVFGIILGNWVLLTGFGGYLGRKANRIRDKKYVFALTLIGVAVILPVTVFFARVASTLTLYPGETAGLLNILVSTILVMSAYCVLYGFQVILACSILSDEEDRVKGIGNAYLLDTVGDISGGVLFSFLLIYFLDSTQVSYLVAALSLTAAVTLSNNINKKTLAYTSFILLVVLAASYPALNLQAVGNRMLYPGQEILFQKNSLYGNIVVTKVGGQINFIENSIPLFSTHNTIENEEVVHYAMPQVRKPENVLLVSGGVSGTLEEILKYNPKAIDYVELDPMIIDAARMFTEQRILDDSRVKTINADGRLFVKQSNRRYDAVLIDLPDPTTAQLNRFYTLEFYSEVKEIMKPGGVLSLSLSSSANYMNPETRRLNSVVYKTLKTVFRNVIIIPGDTNRFIASDSPLSYDIPELLSAREIKTDYVNEDYLKGILTEDRIRYVMDAVKEDVDVNTDFHPVGYFHHMSYWMKQFHYEPISMLVLLSILMLLFYFRLKPVHSSVFSVGFAGTTLEVVLLISFQVLYGYVYHKVGVIVTAFMIGLAVGAYYVNKNLDSISTRNLRLIPYSISAYALLLPAVLTLLSTLSSSILVSASTQVLFPALTSVIGFHVGALFPLASKARMKVVDKASETAGSLFAVDLAGAFFGAVLASTLLIPLYGIHAVCLLTAGINLLAGYRTSRVE
jgi:spermidine synthase